TQRSPAPHPRMGRACGWGRARGDLTAGARSRPRGRGRRSHRSRARSRFFDRLRARAEVRLKKAHHPLPRIVGGALVVCATTLSEERVTRTWIDLDVVRDVAACQLSVERAAGAGCEVLLRVRADHWADAADRFEGPGVRCVIRRYRSKPVIAAGPRNREAASRAEDDPSDPVRINPPH